MLQYWWKNINTNKLDKWKIVQRLENFRMMEPNTFIKDLEIVKCELGLFPHNEWVKQLKSKVLQ